MLLINVMPLTFADIDKIRKYCKTRPCEGHILEVSAVTRSRSVKVTGYGSTTSKETFELYFENTRRSQGGEVEGVEKHFEEDAFIVTFKNHEGKLLAKGQKICLLLQIH